MCALSVCLWVSMCTTLQPVLCVPCLGGRRGHRGGPSPIRWQGGGGSVGHRRAAGDWEAGRGEWWGQDGGLRVTGPEAWPPRGGPDGRAAGLGSGGSMHTTKSRTIIWPPIHVITGVYHVYHVYHVYKYITYSPEYSRAHRVHKRGVQAHACVDARRGETY